MTSSIKKEYPVAFKWIISERKLKHAEAKSLRSERFNVDLFKGFIVLKPQNNRARISVSLHKQYERPSTTEIDCDLTVEIESAHFSSKINQTLDCRQEIIKTFEVTLDNLKNFFVDEKLTLILKGYVLKMIPRVANPTVPDEIQEKNLWNDAEKDFTIVVEKIQDERVMDTKELKVHKLFLRANSTVFQAMFKSNLKEAIENRVVIKDFAYEIVEIAVRMCYGFQFLGTIDQAYQLLIFFDKYDNKFFKAKIEAFLLSRLNQSTVCQMANVSIIANSPRLREQAVTRLKEYADQKLAIADFDILDVDIASNFNKDMFLTICHSL